jgi:hypothetical protein
VQFAQDSLPPGVSSADDLRTVLDHMGLGWLVAGLLAHVVGPAAPLLFPSMLQKHPLDWRRSYVLSYAHAVEVVGAVGDAAAASFVVRLGQYPIITPVRGPPPKIEPRYLLSIVFVFSSPLTGVTIGYSHRCGRACGRTPTTLKSRSTSGSARHSKVARLHSTAGPWQMRCGQARRRVPVHPGGGVRSGAPRAALAMGGKVTFMCPCIFH